jgi:hypothetical protein
MYNYQGESFVLVWTAHNTTAGERKLETNISARWLMAFDNNGLPSLLCVPTSLISRCLYCFEHTKSKEHLPSQRVPAEQQDLYVIDEAYERYLWALNYLDESRWNVNSSS